MDSALSKFTDNNSFNIASSSPARSTISVKNAIRSASNATGVPFAYLVSKASVESSFNPDAKNTSSSAVGLFQFTKTTWLEVVKRYGDKYGIDSQGKSNQQILDMRYNPEASSTMAGALTLENSKLLGNALDRPIKPVDLYVAHFFGAGNAVDFLKAVDNDPNAIGKQMFPEISKVNQGVFFSSSGNPRTVVEILDFFDMKMQGANQDANNGGERKVNSYISPSNLQIVSDSVSKVFENHLTPGQEFLGSSRHPREEVYDYLVNLLFYFNKNNHINRVETSTLPS